MNVCAAGLGYWPCNLTPRVGGVSGQAPLGCGRPWALRVRVVWVCDLYSPLEKFFLTPEHGSSPALQLPRPGGPSSGVLGTCSLLGHWVPASSMEGAIPPGQLCLLLCLPVQAVMTLSVTQQLPTSLRGSSPAGHYLCAAWIPAVHALPAKETGLRVDITFPGNRTPQPWR